MHPCIIYKMRKHYSKELVNVSVQGVHHTGVKGLRSGFKSSDLSRTSVTGPGSRHSSSSLFTRTLQYLQAEKNK